MTMSKATNDVRVLVTKALDSAAASPSLSIQPGDVPSVSARVVAEVAPAIDHLTNNEDWFRSRVMLGSITAIVAGIAGLVSEVKMGTFDVTVISGSIFSILGGGFSIYGRFMSRKPIGE
jgi:hypothetical protein